MGKRGVPAQVADEVIVSIVSAQYQLTADVTQSLIEMLESQLAEARAEIELIRESIDYLVSKEYVPSSDAIWNAANPTRYSVDKRAEALLIKYRRQDT